MKWFKALKKWATETVVEVELKALNKDVSEPVISFIRTFNANPKRFKIVCLDGKIDAKCLHRSHPIRSFLFFDKVTKQKWDFSARVDLNLLMQLGWNYRSTHRDFINSKDSVFIQDVSYLTKDERELIVKTIHDWHNRRVMKRLEYGERHILRRERLRVAKAEITAKAERERLKGVYNS